MNEKTELVASAILEAARTGTRLQPFSDGDPGFGLHQAYRVSARILQRRMASGERPVGWKIGFTNATIWDEYGVHAPIWAPVYDSTTELLPSSDGPGPCSLVGLAEPRIEPEIILRLARPPAPDMSEPDILDCIDAVSHGFEIVQSLFPDWRFKAADTVAAFALHGRLRYGPLIPTAGRPAAEWLDRLANFRIRLFRDGKLVDTGIAANVLGGPLSALRHLVGGMKQYPIGLELRAGDLITTGTVTRAFPIRQGETWSTEVEGLPAPGAGMVLT